MVQTSKDGVDNLLKFFKFDNSDYEKKEMSKKDILCRIENLPSLIMIPDFRG